MLEQLQSPNYLAEVAVALTLGLGTVRPAHGTPYDGASALLLDERSRLASAKLWSVSNEMVQLAVQAGKNLPNVKLGRHDIPSTCGLLVYDSPIAHYVNPSGELVSIVAASWGPSVLAGSDDIWVTFWSLADHEIIARTVHENYGYSMSKARRFARESKPSGLHWDNEVVLRLDDHQAPIADRPGAVDNETDQHILQETTAEWVQTLRATWLLLKPRAKKIAEVEELHVPRSIARRQQRSGVTDTSGVNVVRVHSSRQRGRPSAAAEHGEGGKLSVRFPVSGHIRWQPYPSTGTVEPILIETYDKGPIGAPYRVGANYTVYRLDELPSE